MVKIFDVAVIGGGASGLFAAAFLKKKGGDFVVLEKGDRPGRKLLLTGHGRCNITNRKDPAELKKGYREAGNFIYYALKKFTPDDAVMFPVSDSSSTILEALLSYIGEENIRTGFCLSDIERDDDGTFILSSDDGTVHARKVILATGGKTFPQTGSDGKSYTLAERIGHKITPLIPALTGVTVSSRDREFTSEVAGVSVNAGASLYYDQKKKADGIGDVLFTHKGLSGPVILELSREIPRDITSRDGWIELDFTPGRTDEEVDAELLEEMKKRPDAKLTTLVSEYVPSSLSNAIGKRAGVTDITGSRCDRSSRKECLRDLKHLQLHIDEPPAYETAYVTRGGVALKEIKRESMESKIAKGLYIIGEMADIDGRSGGYNLQAAMSEAFIAVTDIMS